MGGERGSGRLSSDSETPNVVSEILWRALWESA